MCARALPPTDDPVASPGTFHPLVCPHPETGASVLYLGRRRNAYIEGLSLAESEALLDELWGYATRDELNWYNTWRVGDLVLWDNRCTMHRRDPFDAGSAADHASHADQGRLSTARVIAAASVDDDNEMICSPACVRRPRNCRLPQGQRCCAASPRPTCRP